jgi:hypothetical protein
MEGDDCMNNALEKVQVCHSESAGFSLRKCRFVTQKMINEIMKQSNLLNS